MLNKLKENWNYIKSIIFEDMELSEVSYNTWIVPMEIYDMDDSSVTILIKKNDPTSFVITHATKRFKEIFEFYIEEILGTHYDVVFIVDPKKKLKVYNSNTPSKKENQNLNSKYTFDSFVVGNNNEFAHAACLSVAETPGEVANPLYLYGGPGLGKTHLMQAIANFILTNNPESNLIYTSSEEFTNEIIDCLTSNRANKNKMSDLKEKYRNVDVLLIDDIQFIIGKESTQEEFFNTFNTLYENKKQIVISSDRPPSEFITLNERLRSRFKMGLMADISAPDYETRVAILNKKEEIEGYTIDHQILQYIAYNLKSNIRELEGALNKIIYYSKMSNKPLDLERAKEILKDYINPDVENAPTIDRILEIVAEHFDISVEDIKSKKRTQEIARPRQIAMYLIRIYNDVSLEKVGEALGKRDHSTIIHGFSKISKEIQQDEELQTTIETLKKKIQS